MEHYESFRGQGKYWGSPINQETFLPCRVEKFTGKITGAETVVSGLDPQGRTNVQSVKPPAIGSFTLENKGSTVVFDYGVSVAGIAFFDVASASPDVQIQVTFSEPRSHLDLPSGDGPISYLAGPATYRNPILRPKVGRNLFVEVQGGQRWQKLTLLTEGRVTFTSLGFIATISTLHPTQLPSTFSCSNEKYNYVWDAGARTMQLCTAAKGSTPPLWEVTPQGALISATRAVKHRGSFDWKDYTLTFDVTVHRAGCGWGVSMTNLQGYIFYINRAGYLRAGRPESERLTEDSISAVWGFTDEDATSVENIYLRTLPIPKSVSLDHIITISTRIFDKGIVVSINDEVAYDLPPSELHSSPITQSTEPQGCFGFGPGPDGLATYSNVFVNSNVDGRTLYRNKMDSQQSLEDFGAGTTTIDCLLDGGKRDRVVWGGDAAIMGPPVAYSTYALDALKGTIDLLASYRGRDGRFASQVPPTHPFGPGVIEDDSGIFYRIKGFYFSLSYELYMVQTVYDAWIFGAITDDQLRDLFPAMKDQIARVETFIDDKGLIFCGPDNAREAREYNYYDPPRLGHSTKLNAQYVLSLKQSMEIAEFLKLETVQSAYQAQATRTAQAINQHLWNEEIRAYSITAASREVIAQDANVYCVLSGVADEQRSKTVLETLSRELAHPKGILAFDRKSKYRESISNFVSGWHLFATFQAGASDHAKEILDKIFVPPASPDHPNFTGTLWELMLTDGSPGMGGFTSFAHGWAAAATAALSGYVAGVRPTSKRFETFTVAPMSLGLSSASASVATPAGQIEAQWSIESNSFVLRVSAPSMLKGSVDLSQWGFAVGKEYEIRVDNDPSSRYLPEKAEIIDFTGEIAVNVIALSGTGILE